MFVARGPDECFLCWRVYLDGEFHCLSDFGGIEQVFGPLRMWLVCKKGSAN